MPNPKCFIIYSQESNQHQEWVARLAVLLEHNEVDVYLDQQDVDIGMDLAKYVETCIRESDFILLICTPRFAQRVNDREGVVGFENQIIAGTILEGSLSPRQVVPILRKGSRKQSIPSYMKGKVYIDFRSSTNFAKSLRKLLRHILLSRKHQRLASTHKTSLDSSSPNQLTSTGQSTSSDRSRVQHTTPVRKSSGE